MAETRGVFSLRTIVKKKILSDWVELNDVWVSPSPTETTTPNTGYFAGGQPTNLASIMDKTTYSTDTTAAAPGANLTVGRQQLAATGNSEAGYFGGGGSAPGLHSTMEKVTYSSDTTAAVPEAALSLAAGYRAAAGNSEAGYFGGGGSTLSPLSTMDKVNYSTDTTAAVPGAALTAARYFLAASGARANALPLPPAATPTPQTYNGSPVSV